MQPVENPPRYLTYVPMESLRPAVRNAQRHDREGIRASISRHGFAGALEVDERTGRLVAGHGRLEDLVERFAAGEPPPDGILIDADDGRGWLIPVLRGWSSKDEAHAEAYILAHNDLPGRVPPDVHIHLAMLESIQAADVSLFDELAVSADQLDDMLRQAGGPNVELLPDADDPNDGKQTIDVPSRPGEEQESTLDELENKDDRTGGKDPSTVQCPACGHQFLTRV